MPAFEYKAMDLAGKERKGVREGDTARQVRQLLRDEGLLPVSVDEVSEKHKATNSGGGTMRGGMRISANDLALLTRQLATLIRSALPLEEALATVSKQSEKQKVKSLIMAVRSKVLEGHSLAAALSDFPRVFPELYRATVRAGETSGHMDVVLERLAEYTESRQQMQQKIQMALLYPVILTVIAILVTIALLTYVVPEVIKVFDSMDQELPPLTVGLIAVSDFLKNYGIYLLIVIIAASIGFGRMMRLADFRRKVHVFYLRMPVVARLTRGMNTARFARTFSILASSGVPVLEAMRISAEVIANMPMREAVEGAADRVREGAAIARSLESSKLFPPMAVHLIGSGEVSGDLEVMLERAAENQERELQSTVATVVGLFEPLLIVSMGGVVLIIVLAILLPIFNMNQMVQ